MLVAAAVETMATLHLLVETEALEVEALVVTPLAQLNFEEMTVHQILVAAVAAVVRHRVTEVKVL
jgi:hypothetical protein